MDSLVLYCPDARWLTRVRGALAGAHDLVVCEAWRAFERAAPRAGCLLVVVEWLRGAELADRLGQLRLQLPLQPLVLVTAKDADALRDISHVVVDEVVWPHEVERSLAQVVARTAGRTPLERIAGLIDSSRRLPPPLRAALLAALRAARPLGTLQQAAEAAGCDRRTLWRACRGVSGLDLRVQDLLDWILLLRLSVLKVPGRKWSGIAGEAGLHEHSVARMIRRLTGLTLRAFAAEGAPGILRRFERDVLPGLLGTDTHAAAMPLPRTTDAAAAGTRRGRARMIANA